MVYLQINLTLLITKFKLINMKRPYLVSYTIIGKKKNIDGNTIIKTKAKNPYHNIIKKLTKIYKCAKGDIVDTQITSLKLTD